MNDALGLPESVLVLGGGSDIGRAIVRSLIARRTRRVILGGRPGSSSLGYAAAEALALGATVDTFDFDARHPEDLPAAVDAAWQGDVDLVLIAFGLLGDQALLETNPSAAAELATVNFTAVVTAGLACANRLRAQGHGTLVVLSSVAGERVRRANFVYGSAKAGMDGFSQGLGDALAGSGARVMVVRPGFVRSRMTAGMEPAPMATTPDAVADAVIDGLGKGKHTVWVPAPLRLVMAVFRHLPKALWRKVPA